MEHLTDSSQPQLPNALDQKIIKDIALFYSLGSSISIIPETRGFINDTFHLISPDGKYTATFFSKKNNVQVQTIAEIMILLEGLPLAKPLRGHEGYVYSGYDIPVLVCPFVEGVQAVSEDHTIKVPIETSSHRLVSRLFWDLHKQLMALTAIGRNLPLARYQPVPSCLEDINRFAYELGLPSTSRDKIGEFCIKCQESINEDQPSDEPILVHSDFERQNVLFAFDGRINGIVDFDALKRASLVYEFSHTLFNFVCCDPAANQRDLDIYLDDFVKVGLLPTENLGRIYSLMNRFCIDDVLGFMEIARKRPIDIDKIVNHYAGALVFAYNNIRL